MKHLAFFCATAILIACCQGGTRQEAPADTGQQKQSVKGDENADNTEKADRLIVYYFHTTYRCATCNMFERITKEIVESDFAKDVSSGRLKISTVNIEEEANKHFINDYRLYTKAIILSSVAGNQQTNWANLDKIWELARSEDALREYIRNGIASRLKALKGY